MDLFSFIHSFHEMMGAELPLVGVTAGDTGFADANGQSSVVCSTLVFWKLLLIYSLPWLQFNFFLLCVCCTENSVPRTEHNNVNKTNVETQTGLFSVDSFIRDKTIWNTLLQGCLVCQWGIKDGNQTRSKGNKEAWEKLSMCSPGKGISRGKVVPNIRWVVLSGVDLGDSLWVQTWMMERQPREDDKKTTQWAQSAKWLFRCEKEIL